MIFGPIDFDSPEAEQMKKDCQFYLEWNAPPNTEDEIAPMPISPTPVERIPELLNQCEAGQTDKWWQIAFWLMLSDSGTASSFDDVAFDLRKSNQWTKLNPTDQHRIIEMGKRYLLDQKPEPENWINTVGKVYRPVLAGYKALWLLFTLDEDFEFELLPDVWQRWASVVVAYPEIVSGYPIFSDAAWQEHHKILTLLAYLNVPQAVIDAIIEIIDQHQETNMTTQIYWQLEGCWDEFLLNALADKLFDSEISHACYLELL